MARVSDFFLRGVPLIALLLVGCAPLPQSGTPADSDAALTGSTLQVASFRSYRGVDVPMPGGNWVEVGEVEDNSFPRFPQRQVVYASVQDGVIDRLVTVWWQQRTPPDWFTPFAHCSDASFPFSEVKANARNSHDCWHVRPVSMAAGPGSPRLNTLVSDFADRQGLYLPLAMLGVRFVQSQGTRRHYIEYLWNTDLMLPRGTGAVWQPEDWYAGTIAGAPQRTAIANAVRDWGAAWRANIR